MTEYEKEVLESVQRKLARAESRLDQVMKALSVVYKQGVMIMATLDDVKALAQANADLTAKVVTLVQSQQVDMTKVQAVADQLTATNAALTGLIPATPAA